MKQSFIKIYIFSILTLFCLMGSTAVFGQDEEEVRTVSPEQIELVSAQLQELQLQLEEDTIYRMAVAENYILRQQMQTYIEEVHTTNTILIVLALVFGCVAATSIIIGLYHHLTGFKKVATKIIEEKLKELATDASNTPPTQPNEPLS